MTNLNHRIAARSDLEALKSLMDLAISENQKDFLTPGSLRLPTGGSRDR